ncbi:MAG: hypothetical protein IJC17_05145 [Clostridia bacterium]|nr:hypothetical protein [Clostridia bacterium]
MKKLKIMVCSLLVLALFCSFCGCSGSGAKYKVQYTDGSVHQLTSKKIIELYNQEPTRDNPNNVIKNAIISGTGTVTAFSCDDSESKTSDYQYACDYYNITIDDSIYITFRIQVDSGMKLQLYVGDKIKFIGKLSSEFSSITSVELYPMDGYHLRAGNSTGITLVE